MNEDCQNPNPAHASASTEHPSTHSDPLEMQLDLCSKGISELHYCKALLHHRKGETEATLGELEHALSAYPGNIAAAAIRAALVALSDELGSTGIEHEWLHHHFTPRSSSWAIQDEYLVFGGRQGPGGESVPVHSFDATSVGRISALKALYDCAFDDRKDYQWSCFLGEHAEPDDVSLWRQFSIKIPLLEIPFTFSGNAGNALLYEYDFPAGFPRGKWRLWSALCDNVGLCQNLRPVDLLVELELLIAQFVEEHQTNIRDLFRAFPIPFRQIELRRYCDLTIASVAKEVPEFFADNLVGAQEFAQGIGGLVDSLRTQVAKKVALYEQLSPAMREELAVDAVNIAKSLIVEMATTASEQAARQL